MATEPVDILEVEYYDDTNEIPIQGNTPFGYFDADLTPEAPKIAKRIAYNLGYPVNDLEITYENIYSNIETAMMKFAVMMNEFKVTENYFNLVGKDVSSVNSDKLIYPNMDYYLRLSSAYATETGIGGDVPMHMGFIETQKGKQLYNLKENMRVFDENGDVDTKEGFSQIHGNESGLTIREVFHNAIPPSVIGNQTASFVGVDSADTISGQFGFGAGSYSNSYTLLPLSWNVQRMQSIKMARDIRSSSYGFEITGGVLRLFPIPKHSFKLHFKYSLASEEKGANNTDERYDDSTGDIINDPTKINFSHFQWNDIYARDRFWVMSYSEALVKITLGENRRKFSSLQYPNGDVSLNGDALVSEGKEEIRQLEEDMKEYLGKLSKERALDIEQQTTQALSDKLRKIPLGIYRY